jgi:hypothetical protein
MGLIVVLAVVIPAVLALLWWVDRRNPDAFRGGNQHADDYLDETRKDWGPG